MVEKDADNNDAVESPLFAINISKGGIIVADKVDWAGSSAQRRHGLLGRQSLSPEEGMYIAPSQWIHTFGMQFPIDIVFLAKDGRVLSIYHSLKPNRLSKISFRAEGALELAAGRLLATNTEVGDIIKFQEASLNRQ